MTKGKKITIFVIALLVIDQVSKILVKTNMTLGQSINVIGDWFQIYFVENAGMAFGMSFGGVVGKFLLSFFRIVLGVAMFLYIRKLLKRDDVPTGVLYGIAAIMCGAIGNIFDSLFYGLIFSESGFTQVATLFPEGGGYAGPFFGKVVDMLYFPIIDTTLPDWFPIWGGKPFLFFSAIFNFADSCITVGAFYLLIFQWRFFAAKENN
ncbi:MAG: lipoprotein signal peptidase [Bacteroidales bacterium]|nr:lipoprotein signal peptidase [Bacteroidales bacterium]MBR3526323.1 lipoprotein signal peptidase [Bacteroidales bacterium]MCR5828314.1 lipoprotein signal peptidase [Bacteroidales bacterium]